MRHLTLVSDESSVVGMTTTPQHNVAEGPWAVLGVFPTVNGQWKLTAKRGALVVHIDRLTEAQVEATTQESIQTFWNR